MRYYDNLSFKQISEITGDSEATLKTNYHYAAKRIKSEITTIEL
jgi:RNA polymerase sigma-70 factor (ECF subfamily)